MRRAASALEVIDHRTRQIRASCAPSDNERQALAARHEELSASLRPGDPVEMKRSIASLRAVLPAAPGTEASAQLVLAAYLTVLQPFPIWAVNEVCRKYLDGSLSSNGFAPPPPEMATRCREAVSRFKDEQAQLEAILSAEVYDDPTPESMRRARLSEEEIQKAAESRAAFVKRVWDDRKDEFKTDAEPGKRKESPDEIMARLERERGKRVVVGESLAAKLAEMTGGRDA